MDAAPALHPDADALRTFGLGTLDDPAAEEVARHLESCEGCRRRVASLSADSFLDRVRDARPAPPAPNPDADAPASGWSRVDATRSHAGEGASGPPPAETLPPGLADHPDYEVTKELGRGGMGVVYLAHNRLMGRDEVLKVMDRALAARPGLVDRFLREIRAVARLRHPNIVTAYSALRLGESIAFAMEYVPGLDLARLVKLKGPMPVAHACLFAHQAALGLQHAFEEGLVHRDIKPGNLILSRRGDRATVKVLDFGLAKATSEQRLDSALTREGQALGTPDYIAPEQILDAPHADIRADLYSLGGTLYFLLTGHPPFRAGSLYDLYQAHISRDADPLNLLRPEVPAELAALVSKLLAKDPSRRFQTPAEVADALAPFFKKAKAPASPPAVLSQPDRPRPSPSTAPTDPATSLKQTTVSGPSTDAHHAESPWASLIDVGGSSSLIEPLPAPPPPRRPRRLALAAGAAGAVMLAMFALWLGVVRVRTPAGIVVLEGLPPDASVFVDGEAITVDWPGSVGPVEIQARSGEHRLEVKTPTGTLLASSVEFRPHGDNPRTLSVRLESDGPAPVDAVGAAVAESRPPSLTPQSAPTAESQPSPDAMLRPSEPRSQFVRLFDGTTLDGWIFPCGNRAVWSVDDGCLVGRDRDDGELSIIATERSDYDNFRLRMEVQNLNEISKVILFRTDVDPDNLWTYSFSLGGLAPAAGILNPLGKYVLTTGGHPLDGSHFTIYGTREIKAPTMRPLSETWHLVEVEAVDDTFRMIVDGREVSAFQDLQARHERGRIGIRLGIGGALKLRKIEVRELSGVDSTDQDALRPLFNGRDTTGWKKDIVNQGTVDVRDGLLTLSGADRDGRAPAIVVSERHDFSDFRLRLVVSSEDDKSKQVVVRRSRVDENSITGYGVSVGGTQTADQRTVPIGSIWKAGTSGGGHITFSVLAEPVSVPLGGWYTLDIVAEGNTISSFVNGQKVAEYTDDGPSTYDSGEIAIMCQARASIQFREIAVAEARPGTNRVDAAGGTGGSPTVDPVGLDQAVVDEPPVSPAAELDEPIKESEPETPQVQGVALLPGELDPRGVPANYHPGEVPGVAVWVDEGGIWHLRVSPARRGRVVRGKISVRGGSWAGLESISAAGGRATDSGRMVGSTFWFEFRTPRGTEDGINFRIDGPDAVIVFEIDAVSGEIEPRQILIGASGANPKDTSFELSNRFSPRRRR